MLTAPWHFPYSPKAGREKVVTPPQQEKSSPPHVVPAELQKFQVALELESKRVLRRTCRVPSAGWVLYESMNTSTSSLPG